MFIHLHIVEDRFCATTKAELSKDSQKYLLPGPLRENVLASV